MKLSILFILAWTAFGAGAQETSIKSPNISANTLFLYRQSNFAKEDTGTTRNGLDLQEAEIAFYADVDPYSRLFVLLGIHPKYELNTTTNKVEKSWGIEPEEIYAESTRLPSVTLKGGKFKAAFGKHNPLHTHVFPFIDAPMINSTLLGDEGLNDTGVSLAGLLPTPWFSEITGQYLSGEGENHQFSSPTPSDGVGLGRWKNLFDLNDELTLEAGASYAEGGNALGGSTSLLGADLTFKWRPVSGGKYHSWVLAGEYIQREMEQTGVAAEKGSGLAVWARYQISQRWAALARYENLDIKNSNATVNPEHVLDNGLTERSSFAMNFTATEFSMFRLEYDMSHGPAQANGETDERRIYLQGNFTIGAHPSHTY